VFENLLKSLGVLARPLLLAGSSVVIIALYGVAAMLIARLWPRIYPVGLGALAAVATIVVALLSMSPSDSTIGVIIEVIVLSGTVLLVDSFARELALFTPVDNDRRVLLRNLFYGARHARREPGRHRDH